jgi:hypothetical protein
MDETLMWALVVIGGPVLLGLALALSKLRTMKQTRREDPNTPADDPSRGM